MRFIPAFPGARLVDSYPFSVSGTAAQARALKATGIDGLVGYLGAMNAERLGFVIDAGLAFMPVTFAGEYKDGAADELAQLKALGIPAGATVWLDMEGTTDKSIADLVNRWASAVVAGGYTAGLYVGAPQPFTAAELYKLAPTRYWKSGSRVPEPDCGFCMVQVLPQHYWKDTGVFVDANIVGQDFRGRVPTMVVGG